MNELMDAVHELVDAVISEPSKRTFMMYLISVVQHYSVWIKVHSDITTAQINTAGYIKNRHLATFSYIAEHPGSLEERSVKKLINNRGRT